MSLRLRLHPYRLALSRPWHSARQRIDERRGWLVSAETDGITGYGDCAPLPEAGTEPAADALRQLRQWCEHGPRDGDDLLTRLDARRPTRTPAADTAVEAALLDLAARRAGMPLRRLLARLTAPAETASGTGRPGNHGADRVPVNAMLGTAAGLTEDALGLALEQGFRVIKLKLGTVPWPEERARIDRALARLPAGAALRLDANGAWEADHAAAALADLTRLDDGRGRIECLEEPLRRPDDRLLAALQAQAPFPLALDESLSRRVPLDPTRLPVQRLVLKPPVHGGLRATLDLATRALAAGREVVLTSLVESAAGLWTTAQLAAAIPSVFEHGLDTADWLHEDLGMPPRPVGGWIALPDAAGSGFTPWRGTA